MGTPAYMAPEVWRGEAPRPEVDQYALACVVVEMLTGEVLFPGATPAEVMTRHLVEGPRWPERWSEGVPAGVEAVLRRALAQDPKDRYPDVRAFAEALAGLEAPEPVRRDRSVWSRGGGKAPAAETRPASRPEPPPPPSMPRIAEDVRRPRAAERRGRWAWGALAGLVAVLLLASWWPAVSRRLAGALTTPAVTATSVIGGQASPTVAASTTIVPSPTATSMATPSPTLQWPVSSRTPNPPLVPITVSNVEHLTLLRILDERRRVHNIAFSPDGTLLASTSEDNTVKLWRVSDGTLVRTLAGHEGDVDSVAFSPDGELLASAVLDTVRLWRTSDGQLLRTFSVRYEGSIVGVASMAFSPDGQLLAVGSRRAGDGLGLVYLLQASTGQILRILIGYDDVAFSPDGQLLALQSSTVPAIIAFLQQPFTGERLRTLQDGYIDLRGLVFSPDGSLLAVGSSDGMVRLWRVSDGALVRRLEGHKAPIASVAFSPDGRLLASGTVLWDNTVRLWRVSDGALVRTLEGHEGSVISVAFSPDGTLLASGSDDSTVRLWGVP